MQQSFSPLTKLESGSSESSFGLGLTLGICPWPAESSFRKNPLEQFRDYPHSQYLITLAYFNKNPVKVVEPEFPPCPWCFLLVIFYPLTPTLILVLKLHLSLLNSEWSSTPLPYCKPPSSHPLNKVCLTNFGKCQNNFFFNLLQG